MPGNHVGVNYTEHDDDDGIRYLSPPFAVLGHQGSHRL